MENLKALRLSKSLSQAEIARKADIAIASYIKYENGALNINNLKVMSAFRLAQALDCKIEEFLDFENPSPTFRRGYVEALIKNHTKTYPSYAIFKTKKGICVEFKDEEVCHRTYYTDYPSGPNKNEWTEELLEEWLKKLQNYKYTKKANWVSKKSIRE